MLYWLNYNVHICVLTAKRIQLSGEAQNALTPFGCYVMTLRGEVNIRVRIRRTILNIIKVTLLNLFWQV